MNYSHAFHAGNFADVVKHITLVRILLYLQNKPAAFRLIDTHAGGGRYDLAGDEARRGGEWQRGIARLISATLPDQAAALVAPYLDIVRRFNPPPADSAVPESESTTDTLAVYPGSPLIARALLRPQDSMVVCEIEPAAHRQLIAALRRDEQARVVDIDGWAALNAYVPPKERRGLVLIDPAFEVSGEFERMFDGFAAAFAKWPTGTYMMWYPAKDRRAADVVGHRVAALTDKCLRIEWTVPQPPRATRVGQGRAAASAYVNPPLATAGLLIVNPPFVLAQELNALMPAVMTAIAPEGGGHFLVDRPKS